MIDIYKDYPWSNYPMMWEQWLKEVPRPTLEEFKLAEKRYKDDIIKNDAELAKEGRVDWSDWRSGLIFVMSTYNRWIWWKYFFPEAKECSLLP